MKYAPQQYLRYLSEVGGKTAMKSQDYSLSLPEKKRTSDKKRRSWSGAITVLEVRKYLRQRNNIK